MTTRTTQRLTRILAMLPWVIAHKGASVAEVCDRFGYSRRDLLADLDLVFVCGLPGYGPGDLMVAYVEDEEVIVDTADYFGAAPRLNSAEALALLAAGLTMVGAGHGSESLVSAVDKLSRSLLPDDADVLTVDVQPDHGLVARLRDAAADHQVCQIEYQSLATDEVTTRMIEPWSVFTSLGNWYVSANCRRAGAERTFRIDRIRNVDVSSEVFVPPQSVPEPALQYNPSSTDAISILRLKPAAFWVADYYPVEVIERGDELLTVRFSAFDPMVAARLMLRLGSSAEIVEGDEVEQALMTLRQTILRRYRA